MEQFASRAFCKSILDLAQAYGPYEFWTENLKPKFIRRRRGALLMVVAALKDPMFAEQAMELLGSPDSRVRAWACTALAELKCQPAAERMAALTNDPAGRVRFRAKTALASLGVTPPPQRRILFHDMGQAPLVLISEDNETNRQRWAEYLRQAGFQVETAISEQQTVERALELHPQAVLTDNQKAIVVDHALEWDNLSGLNMSWDLCRCRGLDNSILFMVTADQVEAIFLWNGGDEYFHKTVDAKDIIRRLQAYLYR